ncbi:MAG: hypothetical protein P0Y59_11420 [Candidatus Sphingomonas phytovorans]|nr:hypothetical protein [Sphingomonas sp.]WEK02257.1 MAG: hypothetical protein P0Y59_11420 [Sphingomonas sp.]
MKVPVVAVSAPFEATLTHAPTASINQKTARAVAMASHLAAPQQSIESHGRNTECGHQVNYIYRNIGSYFNYSEAYPEYRK